MSLISSPPIRACLLTSLESRLCLLYGVSYKTYFTRSPTLAAICIRNAHARALLTALCKSNLQQILQFKGPERFRVQTRGVTIPGLESESESDFHHFSWIIDSNSSKNWFSYGTGIDSSTGIDSKMDSILIPIPIPEKTRNHNTSSSDRFVQANNLSSLNAKLLESLDLEWECWNTVAARTQHVEDHSGVPEIAAACLRSRRRVG